MRALESTSSHGCGDTPPRTAPAVGGTSCRNAGSQRLIVRARGRWWASVGLWWASGGAAPPGVGAGTGAGRRRGGGATARTGTAAWWRPRPLCLSERGHRRASRLDLTEISAASRRGGINRRLRRVLAHVAAAGYKDTATRSGAGDEDHESHTHSGGPRHGANGAASRGRCGVVPCVAAAVEPVAALRAEWTAPPARTRKPHGYVGPNRCTHATGKSRYRAGKRT